MDLLYVVKVDRVLWGWGVLFYGLGTNYYVWLYLYTEQVMEAMNSLPNSTQVLAATGFGTYGGKYKFLTSINMILHSVYFVLSLLAHLTRYMNLRKFCEFLFTTLVLPLCTLVTGLFWTVFAIDRELVYPSMMDLYIPNLMNHACHTFIFILMVFDLMVIPHFRAVGLKAETMTVLTVVILYSSLIVWIKYYAGIWVYPLMRQLSHVELVLFILFCTGVLYAIQRGGVVISQKRWVEEKDKQD